jgi:hypothetical protein
MKRLAVLAVVVLAPVVANAALRFSPLGISITADEQFPNSMEAVYGWRLALFNCSHRGMIGLATAVFVNYDSKDYGYVGGLHTAAIYNSAGNCEFGVWQIAGVCNRITDGGNGFQGAVFYNEVGRYFNGAQIAYVNSTKSLTGLQVGCFNSGGDVGGLQIGLVNMAKSLVGVQLGLLNFVDESTMSMFPVVRIGW